MDSVNKAVSRSCIKDNYNLNELLEIPDDQQPWLLDKLVRRIGINAIAGVSDAGKSTLLIQLAVAIVSNQTHFLDRPLWLATKRVVYIASEDGPDDVAEIVRRHVTSMGIEESTEDRFAFRPLVKHLAIDIRTVCENGAVDLIIIDTVQDFYEGSSNDMNSMRKVFHELRDLCVEFKMACLVVVHHSKGAEQKPPHKDLINGSQAIEGSTRSVIDFRVNPDNINERLLTVVKGNRLKAEDKAISHVVSFNPTTCYFSGTGRTRPVDKRKVSRGSGSTSPKGVDQLTWGPRYMVERESGLSHEKAHACLKAKYAPEPVPGIGWCKDYARKHNENSSAGEGLAVMGKNDMPAGSAIAAE